MNRRKGCVVYGLSFYRSTLHVVVGGGAGLPSTMRGTLISICLVGCLLGVHFVQAQYDDVNMYDDYDVFSAGYDEQYDEYAEDADGNFIDYPEGQDEYGGDYAFDDPEEVFDDCRIGEQDKPTFNGENLLRTSGQDRVQLARQGAFSRPLDGALKL